MGRSHVLAISEGRLLGRKEGTRVLSSGLHVPCLCALFVVQILSEYLPNLLLYPQQDVTLDPKDWSFELKDVELSPHVLENLFQPTALRVQRSVRLRPCCLHCEKCLV